MEARFNGIEEVWVRLPPAPPGYNFLGKWWCSMEACLTLTQEVPVRLRLVFQTQGGSGVKGTTPVCIPEMRVRVPSLSFDKMHLESGGVTEARCGS